MVPLKDRSPTALYCRLAVHTFLGRYPSIFYPLYGMRSRMRKNLVSANTEIVIEGFPRSANTYAVTAFERAQTKQVIIGHHVHAPAPVIRAIQWGIPTLVLIRQPAEAVASLAVYMPHIPIAQALRAYTSFYKTVFPMRAGFVTATFEMVTARFREVVLRINERFDKDFGVPRLGSDEEENVFQVIDRKNQHANHGLNCRTSRPSAQREQSRLQALRLIEQPRYQRQLAAAQDIYQIFTSHTDCLSHEIDKSALQDPRSEGQAALCES